MEPRQVGSSAPPLSGMIIGVADRQRRETLEGIWWLQCHRIITAEVAATWMARIRQLGQRSAVAITKTPPPAIRQQSPAGAWPPAPPGSAARLQAARGLSGEDCRQALIFISGANPREFDRALAAIATPLSVLGVFW